MSDLISRQAAINAIENTECELLPEEWDELTDAITAVPSVQPEIIRCKDCKHRDPEDKKCDCGHAIIWQLPRDDNWFCADAERKIDE